MIGNNYDLWLDDDRGNRLISLNEALNIQYLHVVNNPGWFNLTMPDSFDASLIKVDQLIEIWRRPVGGGSMRLDFAGFIRQWQLFESATVLSGPGIGDLLKRRIVAYYAGSAYTVKTDQADDMMKAIVRENLGSSSTDTNRDLSSLGVAVAGDLALAPEITKAFAWKNVHEVLEDIADASMEQGTDLYFVLEPGFDSNGRLTATFQTYTGQPGHDHGQDSSAPVFFGDVYGNLSDSELYYKYGDEINYVYAGGQGEEVSRLIVELSDSARVGLSVWGRREGFTDARNEKTTEGVTNKGYSLLNEFRPEIRFFGNLMDSPGARYGKDWQFGDKVSCSFRGIQFDGLVRTVNVNADAAGENIDSRIEAVL